MAVTKRAPSARTDLKTTARCLRTAANILQTPSDENDNTFTPSLVEEDLQKALVCLKAAVKVELDLSPLLAEVSNLRKVAMRALLGKASYIEIQNAESNGLLQICHRLVIGCARFLVVFLGTANKRDLEKRKSVTKKFATVFIDSALYSVKYFISAALDEKLWEVALGEFESLVVRLRPGSGSDCNIEKSEPQYDKELDTILVKISQLYTSAFLKERNSCGKLYERPISLLSSSINVLERAGPEAKVQASFATKLEKLAVIYEKVQLFCEARSTFNRAIKHQIDTGILSSDGQKCVKANLENIFGSGGKVEVLGKLLWGYCRASIKISPSLKNELLYWDDDTMSSEQRGEILEWQLEYLCGQQDCEYSIACRIIRSIIQQITTMYSAESSPIRRKRVLLTLLQSKLTEDGVFDSEITELLTQSSRILTKPLASDVSLRNYEGHFDATINVFNALRNFAEDNEKLLEDAVTRWKAILEKVENGDNIAQYVTHFGLWATQLKAICNYLEIRGTDRLGISALEISIRSHQFQQITDDNSIVSLNCKLGRLLLGRGCSMKAGVVLAKAQELLSSPVVTTATKLEWHLAHAEYLLSIGNSERCEDMLSVASDIAESDKYFSNPDGHSPSISERIQMNTLLSEASYLTSVHQLQNGSLQEALHHAKGSVSLTQKNWITVEKTSRLAAIAQTKSSTNKSEPSSMAQEPKEITAPQMSHDSLKGAQFWPLVPSLFKCFCNLANILIHHGLYQESLHYFERAERIATATSTKTYLLSALSELLLLCARSGRLEKAQTYAKKASSICVGLEPSMYLANYYISLAQLHCREKKESDEFMNLEKAEKVLDALLAQITSKNIDFQETNIDTVSEQLSGMKLCEKKEERVVAQTSRKVTRTRKTGTTTASSRIMKEEKINRGSNFINTKASHSSLTHLSKLREDIQQMKALCLLRQARPDEMSTHLQLSSTVQNCWQADIDRKYLDFRKLLRKGIEEISSDFTFNCLLDSTISFPAVSVTPQSLLVKKQLNRSATSPKGSTRLRRTAITTEKTEVNKPKPGFARTLSQAREHVDELCRSTLDRGSTWLVHEVLKSMCQISVLLSAATSGLLKATINPCTVALSIEAPRNCAVLRERGVYRCESTSKSVGDRSPWPRISKESIETTLPNIKQLQSEFIDKLPLNWCAVSISLKENCDELYLARYDTKQSPFLLRLPLGRHASRDLEEDAFGFKDAKSELLEIIQLSTFSTRKARDLSSKGAKRAWWTEREALDRRLQGLLENIENIWLGGFRGIFSQHMRRPDLLARLQKSLESILNRNLPSRQKANRKSMKNIVLDPRIIELFVGLGDPNDENLDLDEPLMDLLYHLVDILQFNGERNAIDEIDFDTMVIEATDALKSYHSSIESEEGPDRHMILILDKQLHCFPWESLQCLEGLSVTRLPSIHDLQTRIHNYVHVPRKGLSMRNTEEHYAHIRKGTSILNPSGDLEQTQNVIHPILGTFADNWEHIIARAPTTDEFASAVQTSDLVLYFGHGSGAQYLANSTLRKSDTQAVIWLMGCSSGAITENDELEPHGTVLNYLTAGAPAVLATLWDVTDKDCDRFSLKCGERWGLWESPSEIEMPKRQAKGNEQRKTRVHERSGSPDKKSSNASLGKAVMESRDACYLRYLNGAAPVIYGIPSFLDCTDS